MSQNNFSILTGLFRKICRCRFTQVCSPYYRKSAPGISRKILCDYEKFIVRHNLNYTVPVGPLSPDVSVGGGVPGVPAAGAAGAAGLFSCVKSD